MEDFLQNISHEFQTPFQNSVLVFSLILFIILLSPIALKRFKIPSIIGLIISGLVIGPHALNLIEKNSAVDLFSTIGLLYLMFLAGLELDLREFGKNKYKSLTFGLLTFIFPIAIGFPICMLLLGYDFNASLLTASMFATHTLVAYPIVSRLGVSKNEAVAITVGGTILTDTTVLIMLAIISASATGGLSPEFWIRLAISILVFLAIVVFLIPRFSAWFFAKLEGEKNSHFIFVLSVVFFCAFLAELVGLEPIIGAFAAGLTLNRLIPHTSSLMNRIEFVGSSLFIPFFLISVGMLVDVRVILQGPAALIVAGTLTVVALAGKWMAAWLTALLMKYSKAQRNVIFGLSSSHAAATLAVILVGYKAGIIDENILNGTIVLILVTCLVASFVTENAAKMLAIEKDHSLPSSAISEQKILVPISNPDTMDKLIDLAITIKKPKSKFPIVSLSVVDDDKEASAKLLVAKQMLEKTIVHAAAADQHVEIMTTIDQNVINGIKRVSKEISATDIIIGFSGDSKLSDMFFGKTLQNIVGQTTQTILVSNLPVPLHPNQKIHILCPRYCDREFGFMQWLDTVFRLSEALNLTCLFHSTPQTMKHIREYRQNNKLKVPLGHHEFTNWEDFQIISAHVQPSDSIAAILPRKGSLSYLPVYNGIPQKMAKHFITHNFLLIYPQVQELFEGYLTE